VPSSAAATLDGLLLLAKNKIINSYTIHIYLYIRRRTGERMTVKDISIHTGISSAVIRRNIQGLVLLEIVERSDRDKLGYVLSVNELSNKVLADVISNKVLAPCLSSRQSSSTNKTKNGSSRVSSKVKADSRLARQIKSAINSKNLSIGDVSGSIDLPYTEDTDWQTARDILVQYFPISRINSKINSNKLFMRLCGLMQDKFDLEAYADWYKNDKGKVFGWGLFLHSGMLEEFRGQYSDMKAATAHLHTASDEMKAKHSTGAKKTKAWIGKVVSKERKNAEKRS